MQPVLSTMAMSAKGKMQGGLPALLGGYLLKLVYLAPLLLMWRSLFAQNVKVDMTLAQMLAYTCLSAILSEQLNVRSPAASWLYEGIIIDLFKRPMGLFLQLMVMTVGEWLPQLMLFSLPVALLAPLLGVSLIPATPWFFLSLLLAMSLGFAVDFLFACLIIRMQNASWLIYTIRGAVTALLSGALIPFALLPWGLGDVMRTLPFGSLAGAPLGLFVGVESPAAILPAQMIWNLVLWPLAAFAFRRSRERMISHGG